MSLESYPLIFCLENVTKPSKFCQVLIIKFDKFLKKMVFSPEPLPFLKTNLRMVPSSHQPFTTKRFERSKQIVPI